MQQILLLDRGGRPYEWATPEEALSLQRRGVVSRGFGSDLEFHGGISRVTGERSVLRLPAIMSVKNQTFAGKVPLNNSTLFARDGFMCCYCAQRFPRSMLTREHIHPKSKGGPATSASAGRCFSSSSTDSCSPPRRRWLSISGEAPSGRCAPGRHRE